MDFLKVRKIPLQQAPLAAQPPDLQPSVMRLAETDRCAWQCSYSSAVGTVGCHLVARLFADPNATPPGRQACDGGRHEGVCQLRACVQGAPLQIHLQAAGGRAVGGVVGGVVAMLEGAACRCPYLPAGLGDWALATASSVLRLPRIDPPFQTLPVHHNRTWRLGAWPPRLRCCACPACLKSSRAAGGWRASLHPQWILIQVRPASLPGLDMGEGGGGLE